MPRHRGSDHEESVDQAMNQVLAAEQRAREAVERCRAEASAIVGAAEKGARRITRRTERRIKAAHRIADDGVDRVLHELLVTEAGDGSDGADDAERARVERAVAQLVDEIVGGSP